jgi:creatinine amidohydrolase
MAGTIWQHIEMNWRQVDALDREKTLYILPVGMIEQHGPHIPVGTDTYGSEAMARQLAKDIIDQKPGWDVVILPTVSYAAHVIEDWVEDPTYRKPPGSIPIRGDIQKEYLIDIGSAVAKWGFKHIVQITAHSEPDANAALRDAAEYVSDKYGLKMITFSGVTLPESAQPVEEPVRPPRDTPWTKEGHHGGVGETEFIMAECPHLVDMHDRANMPSYPNGGFGSKERAEVYTNAGKINWPGYFGSPSMADWDYAFALRRIGAHAPWYSKKKVQDVIRVLDGEPFERTR